MQEAGLQETVSTATGNSNAWKWKWMRDDFCLSASCRSRWSWLRASPAPRRNNSIRVVRRPSRRSSCRPTSHWISSTPEPEELKGIRPLSERPLASPWDSKVGIDYHKPSIPATNFQPEQLTAGAVPDQSAGVAWATVTAPGFGSALGWDQTAIETRVDPAQEQTQLGTKLSRSVPVGEDVSVTLENGVSMSRSLPSGGAQNHGWASSQALRFNVLPTDTIVSIGADISSTDDKWLRTLSAEQKLFGGPFSVTGSVSETPTGDMSKSLRAGFKRTW